jgi:hypothetical protein
MYKILVLILLISFTVEIATPLLRNYSTVSLLMETQETDEKKDNEKKEEKIKDKNSVNTNFLLSIEMVTDFYLKNDLVNTLGFLSLPEMPPDQV